MIIGKIMVIIYITIAVPLVNNPLRGSIINLFYGKVINYSWITSLLLSSIILWLGCGVSLLIPDILVYFNIIGGLFCTYLSFFIPTLFFLKASDSNVLKSGMVLICFAFCGVGIAISVYTVVIRVT